MISLVEEEEMMSRKKTKSKRYDDIKEKVQEIIPWINKQIDDKGNFIGEIKLVSRDLAKQIGFEDKNDVTIYSSLRFVLFFEGIHVGLVRGENGEYLYEMRRVDMRDGLSPSILKQFDNMELDGWYIKRGFYHLTANHMLKKDNKKDEKGNNIYTLESKGDIYFDRRSMTEEQALEFVKYISGKNMTAPYFLYNTPINIILSDAYINKNHFEIRDIDINKLGREFRIVKSEEENGKFIVTSIYGKECIIHEYEMDELIKGGSIYAIMHNFDKALMVEKIPERIEILKKILPQIKTNFPIIIEDNKLIVNNRIGRFEISLVDGTLHKTYDKNGSKNKYICVGPSESRTKNFIIHNGIRYELDIITGSILSKMIMLIREKYPDGWTMTQIMT